MDFLSRRRKVVSISALADALERGESLDAGTVVISFDDGYRDTLELAAPVLERYGLPAIVYLSTGNLTRGENQWVDELYSAFRFRSNQQLRLNAPAAAHYDLEGGDTLREAYHSIAEQLLIAGRSERRALLDEVTAQLSPVERPPRLMLSWPEVKELAERHPGFEIGVHTREHLDLTECGEEEARAEIENAMADIASELRVEAEHLAFPYGRTNRRIREIVARSCVRSAVIGESMSLVHGGTDRFAMSRIGARSAMTRFRFQTCGAYPNLPLALLGRA
jgi:peptidoglycan/xylan/chitin deacetylase (PgdA/CDA1 family)